MSQSNCGGSLEENPRHRRVLYYDGNCGLCARTVRWLSRLDLFGQVTWTPFQSLNEPPYGLSWDDLDRAAYLDTGQGHLYEGYYAFRKLSLRLIPLLPLAPVLWLPGMGLAGEVAYRWVAGNRYRAIRVPDTNSQI